MSYCWVCHSGGTVDSASSVRNDSSNGSWFCCLVTPFVVVTPWTEVASAPLFEAVRPRTIASSATLFEAVTHAPRTYNGKPPVFEVMTPWTKASSKTLIEAGKSRTIAMLASWAPPLAVRIAAVPRFLDFWFAGGRVGGIARSSTEPLTHLVDGFTIGSTFCLARLVSAEALSWFV